MTAFVAFFVDHVRRLLVLALPRSRHNLLVERTPYGVPVPKTIHRTISEKELRGRSLVVIGDVHGCYTELVELLKLCNASDANVCPVFVGDLVRKGPLNAEVIKLVRSLDCYCVRGNSDEVAMSSWQKHIEGEKKLSEKDNWLAELSNEDIEWMFSLPYSLSFPSREMIVVHAGLVPGVDLASQSRDDMLHLRDVTFDSKSLTFSGHVNYQPNGQPWAQAWGGPEHVYFGHDAKRYFQSYPYATGVDLGCVYGGHLAAVIPDEANKLIKVKAQKAYQNVKRVESTPPKL